MKQHLKHTSNAPCAAGLREIRQCRSLMEKYRRHIRANRAVLVVKANDRRRFTHKPCNRIRSVVKRDNELIVLPQGVLENRIRLPSLRISFDRDACHQILPIGKPALQNVQARAGKVVLASPETDKKDSTAVKRRFYRSDDKANAMSRHDTPVSHKSIIGMAHDDQTHAKRIRQFAQGRQACAVGEHPRLDSRRHACNDLIRQALRERPINGKRQNIHFVQNPRSVFMIVIKLYHTRHALSAIRMRHFSRLARPHAIPSRKMK